MANRSIKISVDDEQFKKDVDKLLNLFQKSERKKILRKASRPLVRRLKNLNEFNDYTGEAKESMRAFTFPKSLDYFVGPKKDVFITERPRSKKNNAYHPFYLYFLEYGFTHARSGKYLPPWYWLKNNRDAAAPEIYAIILNEVKDRIRPYQK